MDNFEQKQPPIPEGGIEKPEERESQQERLRKSENEKRYGDLIHKEAISLLKDFLPEAVPQEPTVIMPSLFPQTLGKFKGKYYVLWDSAFDLDVMGDDKDRPERLTQGRSEYSLRTWYRISGLVHELIHQKQEEMSALSIFELSSLELDNVDMNNIPDGDLRRLLRDVHKRSAQGKGSLLLPVMEGMAILGELYVMNRFSESLTGIDANIHERVKKVRSGLLKRIFDYRRKSSRPEENKDDYDINYGEGILIMRKLYKQFGLENFPAIIKKIDLDACSKIIRDTPEYQGIIDNPRSLPGLK